MENKNGKQALETAILLQQSIKLKYEANISRGVHWKQVCLHVRFVVWTSSFFEQLTSVHYILLTLILRELFQ